MTEGVESNKLLEVTDDEWTIHLLINLKYTVVVADNGYPMQNTPHYTSLVFCETNVRYY